MTVSRAPWRPLAGMLASGDAAAFSVEGVLNKLDLLHLHDNQIGAQGMACLVAAMQCGTSDCLKALGQLHLTGNPIGDVGIKQLANAIER